MMDFHCHLDLFPDPNAVVMRAIENGIYILSVTTTPKAFPGTKRLAKSAPRVRTALGLHPQVAAQRFNELRLFELMVGETDYVGEIGLDGSKEYSGSFDIQLKCFRWILDCCSDHGGKVLSIHSKSAASTVLDELEARNNTSTPILHWFTGTPEELARAIELDCWFSVGPAMLKSRKGLSATNQIPKNRLLLETDCPFAKAKGRNLTPEDASLAVPYLSELWNLPTGAVISQLTQNLKQIGNIATRSL